MRETDPPPPHPRKRREREVRREVRIATARPAGRQSGDATMARERAAEGLRLFAALMAGGIALTGAVFAGAGLWHDRTGRQEVRLAGGAFMPPRTVAVTRDGAHAIFRGRLQALAASEDLLAPVSGDGPVRLTAKPYDERSTSKGCGASVCEVGWRVKAHWVVLRWPARLHASPDEMSRFGRRLVARWSDPAVIARGPGVVARTPVVMSR
jgi:hypothetical protein